MKTRNLILTAIFALTLGSASMYASDSEIRSEAAKKLKSDLQSQLQKVSIDDVMETETCRLTLVFKVDEQSNLTDYVVTGNNPELARRVENALSRETLVAEKILNNGTYRVTLNFKNYTWY